MGMTLDFGREKGAVHVLQEEYIDDLVECLNEKLTGNSPSPATSNLLKKGAGGLLTLEKKELFHTIIAKTLFITKRSRPDVGLAVSILSGRV